MTSKLPPSASLTSVVDGAKLHAPAAARNVDALCGLLLKHAPKSGHALEIASGTGQHIVAFAHVLPGITWQPTDVDPARLNSTNAYVTDIGLPNIKPAIMLNATGNGWHTEHAGKDLILLANLLHLIGNAAAEILITEAMTALAPGGIFLVYGPFKRNGALTSEGDQRFDAELRHADLDIGYKDASEVTKWLSLAGAARVKQIEMPANNLAFIASKS